MESNFTKVKDSVDIRRVVEDFGVKLNSRGKGLCPFHMEDTPSFSIKERDNTWHCFGCNTGGDAIDFVSKIKDIDNVAAVELLADMYRIPLAEKATTPKPQKVNITQYIKECISQVDKTDYFKRRGLTAETIRRFNLGYDARRDAVVIPYDGSLTYYQTRGVKEKTFFKPRTEDAGAEPLFNADRLKCTKEPIFVVESPICAMSIEQCGGNAISICGTSGIRKVMAAVKKKFAGRFILALDNDEPGVKASTELASYFFENQIKYKVINIAKDLKDPNELLMRSEKELKEQVSQAVFKTKLAFSTISHVFNCAELQEKVLPPTQWIVQDLLPEGLAMICAPSKYGKSFMMMQLATAVVEGKPFMGYKTFESGVAYFALEDSDKRFQRRLNEIMKNEKTSKKFYGFLDAKAMDQGLFQQLQEVLEFFPKTKLIIIDTLQKVRGKVDKNETAYGSDCREINAFKDFADKHHTSVRLYGHVRKQAEDTDVFNRISGSMGLMGAADTIWVLSRKKRTDTSTSFVATGRDVENTELALEFETVVKTWILLGTQVDVVQKELQQEYENNPVIKTIKALIKRKGAWSGTSSELKAMIYDCTG